MAIVLTPRKFVRTMTITGWKLDVRTIAITAWKLVRTIIITLYTMESCENYNHYAM
jgi:hypothetical protein